MRPITGVMGSVLVAIGALVVYGEIDRRDARIAEHEIRLAAFHGCIPTTESQMTAMAMRADGTIECAMTDRKGGTRKVVERMEF